MVKNLPARRETWVRPLVWEDPLEEGMATCSSIVAWRIPWTEDPGRSQSLKELDMTEATQHACRARDFVVFICSSQYLAFTRFLINASQNELLRDSKGAQHSKTDNTERLPGEPI